MSHTWTYIISNLFWSQEKNNHIKVFFKVDWFWGYICRYTLRRYAPVCWSLSFPRAVSILIFCESFADSSHKVQCCRTRRTVGPTRWPDPGYRGVNHGGLGGVSDPKNIQEGSEQACLDPLKCHVLSLKTVVGQLCKPHKGHNMKDLWQKLLLLLLLLTMYWFKWRCHANDAGALYRVIKWKAKPIFRGT